MSKTTDRSKKWLIDAFFEILKYKNYDDIIISDITKKANLSRRTFYRLFKNKDDLLDFYCEKLFEEYFKFLKIKINSNTKFEDVLNIFFNFWYLKREQIKLLINQDIFLDVMLSKKDQTKKVYTTFKVSWHNNVTKNEQIYIMNFFMGGYLNIINLWLSKNQPEKPEYIATLLNKAIKIIN